MCLGDILYGLNSNRTWTVSAKYWSSVAISAASDSIACFAVENLIHCSILSIIDSQVLWKDISDTTLPSIWPARNFLINTELLGTNACGTLCEWNMTD